MSDLRAPADRPGEDPPAAGASGGGPAVPAPPPAHERGPAGGDATSLHARAALLTGLALLVPVPFLDDWLAERARRDLVGALLARHGRAPDAVTRARALWADPGGCLSGCLGLPLRLLLAPIKKLLKTLFFVLALRSAAMAIGRTLALGRTVERCLAAGRLAGGPAPAAPPDPLAREAARVRLAFDRAFAGTDRHALRQALVLALRGVRGLPAAAAGLARALRGRGAGDPAAPAGGDGAAVEQAVGALPGAQRRALDAAIDAVGAALDDPDVRAVLVALDARFDDALAALERAEA